VPFYEETGEKSVHMAVDGGRRGVDLAGPDELPVVRHRLETPTRKLASDIGRVMVLLAHDEGCDSIIV
jgi:hypothetical protein